MVCFWESCIVADQKGKLQIPHARARLLSLCSISHSPALFPASFAFLCFVACRRRGVGFWRETKRLEVWILGFLISLGWEKEKWGWFVFILFSASEFIVLAQLPVYYILWELSRVISRPPLIGVALFIRVQVFCLLQTWRHLQTGRYFFIWSTFATYTNSYLWFFHLKKSIERVH